MMKKIDYRNGRRLPAWTLPELLLVMVLTGILFLSALDGLELLKRLMLRLQRETGYAYELQKNWELLDRIVMETDSIIPENRDFYLYREGREWICLQRDSGYMICRKENRTDTLFAGVTNIRLVQTEDKQHAGDSLFVTLTAGGRVYPLAFGLKTLLP